LITASKIVDTVMTIARGQGAASAGQSAAA